MEFYKNSFDQLLLEKKDHVLWVTLNDPDKRNALSLEMANSLVTVLDHAEFDSEIRVVVLTGAGKCFSAGGDIKAMAKKEGMFSGEPNELRLNYMKGLQRIPQTIENMSTPIIAMVNGHAIGAGCDLSFMCDLRVAHEKAKFGETFTRLGLIPGVGGTYFLQRIVGYAKAMEIFLTGKTFSASDALHIGAINIMAKDEKDLIDKTQELISQILENSPVALSFVKPALKMAMKMDIKSHLDVLASFQGVAQRTEDHFEGLRALSDKDTPVFKNR